MGCLNSKPATPKPDAANVEYNPDDKLNGVSITNTDHPPADPNRYTGDPTNLNQVQLSLPGDTTRSPGMDTEPNTMEPVI